MTCMKLGKFYYAWRFDLTRGFIVGKGNTHSEAIKNALFELAKTFVKPETI